MAHRIEVALLEQMDDAVGRKIGRRINEDLGLSIDDVRTIQVYTVDKQLSAEQLEACASGPLCDPIIQTYAVDNPLARDFDWLIEVGYLPGVTDNIGRTAREALEVRLGLRFEPGESVYSSIQYLVKGKLEPGQAEAIARDVLGNGLIQRFTVISAEQFDVAGGVPLVVPKVTSMHHPEVRRIDLDVPEAELLRISSEGVLALSLEEMQTLASYYHRPDVRKRRSDAGLPPDRPTDVELECLAQTWSEHCKHKIFNALIDYDDGSGEGEVINSLFNTYIKGATRDVRETLGERDYCLSVFKDNAGVIRWEPDTNLVMKVETHNSPSALDPYGGALTGIVGVNRDPFGTGMGSKLCFNVDTFCFASPFWDKPLPPRLLHPKRILEGVREGVEHGGNKSGIPTVDGGLVFDDRFAGKPLVFCGTGGIMPVEINGKPAHEKQVLAGDLIVMCGGRIGKDGIHGATFSSEALHAGSPATAVQIGDPITQKRMTDFLLVARDMGLYNSITDDGAGGLSSSVGEMARDCGGFTLELDKAPLKYAGLDPWEILISESQERMTLAVPHDKLESLLALSEKMNVESTVLGEFNDSGMACCRFQERTVLLLEMDFLHEGLPQMRLKAVWQPPQRDESEPDEPQDYGSILHKLLARLNVCSREYVIRQYDHEVQGGSVIKPLVGALNDGPSDAAVVRPLLDRWSGVVVSNGICPKFSDIDAYAMAANAVDEAVRNAVAVGGDPNYLAGLDNFCWCDPVQSQSTPDGHHKLAQLVRANKALYAMCLAYGIPLISGKDSMKNDFQIGEHKISIPPTLLFSIIGRVDDVRNCVTMDAKAAGDLVYVLGTTRHELGGSEYCAMFGTIGAQAPSVNVEHNLDIYEALAAAIQSGLVQSCHDASDGGLGVSLAESSFAGDLGIEIDLERVPAQGALRSDVLLFSESSGRFVVTVSPDLAADFEQAMEGASLAKVGTVTDDRTLTIKRKQLSLINENIDELRATWKSTLDF
ncbi:MAG: AIR synthase-related protein [Candidatus Alcyoniella australis]|nr:AIR synthase-related protein [Candidatus Alcyoniella australis]